MSRPGDPGHPLRVAVVGAGPAGFYAAQALFGTPELTVELDMFDRLPTPFGLVRHGVAPDHQKIKKVAAVYDKIAGDERFRFYGGIEFGRDLTIEDLQGLYHQVVFTTGAQTDRRLGIPGEDLAGSHPATEFVAWYNGHPDYQDLEFDLGCSGAVVIGVGNVAVDVARILCRTPDELAETDISDAALEALTESSVRDVHLLGRRGPAQAAFTNPEVKELGALPDASIRVLEQELELDAASRAQVEGDRATAKKLEILRGFLGREESDKNRNLILRFRVSPVELLDDGSGRVGAVRVVHNRLEEGPGGRIRAVPTDQFEEIPAGLVFRSVGYHGVALEGLPFDGRSGTIPNAAGRVRTESDGPTVPGLYVAGWIKRGPSGVIGTNKPCAAETVASMVEDARGAAAPPDPPLPSPRAVDALLESRGLRPVRYEDWRRIDALERKRGEACGRPRVKFTRLSEFLDALDGD